MKNTPGEHMDRLLRSIPQPQLCYADIPCYKTEAMSILASAGNYLLRESDLSEASWAAVATLLACYNAIENEQ